MMNIYSNNVHPRKESDFIMDSRNLAGIAVPLITPLHNDETIDYASLKKLINYVIGGGVHALFPLGTTGEFARLDREDRNKILEFTIAETQKRVLILAGISDTGLQRVLENLKVAEKAGADAVVVSPPYYYPIRSDDEIINFYSDVASKSSLPVILYNIPVTCGSNISLTALEQIVSKNPNVIAIKDSSGNLNYLLDIIKKYHHQQKSEFRIFVGDEALALQGLKAGAHGIVPSLGNVFPRIFVALYQAVQSGQFSKAEGIAAQINEMNKMNLYSNSWMSAIIWRKVALSQLSICSEQATQPYIPVPDDVRKDIGELIKKYTEAYGTND
jgi:dihydrodipicolinate synthase/N-acetylneuraminate lyase